MTHRSIRRASAAAMLVLLTAAAPARAGWDYAKLDRELTDADFEAKQKSTFDM